MKELILIMDDLLIKKVIYEYKRKNSSVVTFRKTNKSDIMNIKITNKGYDLTDRTFWTPELIKDFIHYNLN